MTLSDVWSKGKTIYRLGKKGFDRYAVKKTTENDIRFRTQFNVVSRLNELLTGYHRSGQGLVENLCGPDEKKHYEIEAKAKKEISDFLTANAFCLPPDLVELARLILSKYPAYYSRRRYSWRYEGRGNASPEALLKIDDECDAIDDEIKSLRARFTDRCRQLVGVNGDGFSALLTTVLAM